MTPATLRRWSKIHSWTSLFCTLFLLMLCLTGLPLIFHDDIDSLTGAHLQEQWDDAALVPLDAAVDAALTLRPGEVPIYLSFDIDRPVVNITSGVSADVSESGMTFQPIDRRGAVQASGGEHGGVMDLLLQMHSDMFLGQGGMLFIGLIGLLFVAALVSGIVLYAPFARRAGFARVRRDKSARTRWLDWHNLIGGVTLAWAAVVGLTGAINTLSDPITAWWRADALVGLTKGDGQTIAPYRSGMVGRAVANAMRAAPGMRPQFVAFPGAAFSSRDHYAVFLQGGTPLTEKLLTPVMIDAHTGDVDGIAPMPWYMKGLLLAQPLHFGDYGGLVMKLLWALLDIVTLVVIASGLYIWLKRIAPNSGRRTPTAA
ncbi:peptidase [Altererythrobacter sp. B11]|uniref:PepSY-associated TM helix domain-containing protein n=1 Tax=Altererythrobacter sp. B11 TaxID=2060312 RepID=UPI000DC70AA4|nr:PepSY-associated TM helix domain-containing protein [Altererythrobacter sp. B11]BBC71018.1 peptidase [Altererythrobacter sp. B11]